MRRSNTEPLFDVLRGYATLRPPRAILKPAVPFVPTHEFLLNALLLNPHFQEFPPSKQYQRSFWKWAIEWLEELEEVDERIYTYHIDLIQDTSLKTKDTGNAIPGPSYLTYLWPSKQEIPHPVYPGYASVTLRESRATIENGTTGLRTWSTSLVLAQHVLSQPELVATRRVLELGCGAGFLGTIVASIQLANPQNSSLWLTDANEPVLQQCKANLSLSCNHSHKHPDLNIHLLDWSDAMDPTTVPSVRAFLSRVRPDVILGADLAYDPSIIPLLVQILHVALTPTDDSHNPVAYIALPVRTEETMSEYLRQAGELFTLTQIDAILVADNIFTGVAELGLDALTQVVRVFRIQRA
ncbi:hypothetical protein C8Q80DRAFT_1127820 [Daedaleopsis nitida]|nr:hypothetical protein C8Q80DRAFT_1127820 [Daedaleopsis nitida]